MRYKAAAAICVLTAVISLAAGCGKTSGFFSNPGQEGNDMQDGGNAESSADVISLGSEITELESGLSAIRFDGDYGFEEYLAQGGASSDAGVADFLMGYLPGEAVRFLLGGNPFGCSTVSVQNEAGERMFGRNFDWDSCSALIVKSAPEKGYASISTVNMDFIQGMDLSRLPDEIRAAIAMYAPLDGMNEKGLVVSVNMIQDSETIAQDTEKPDITTTTAVRLLLNQAATTEEAIALLEGYDMHASMDYMVHFAIADANGSSVAVEYVDNEMVVTETPVVTNFYLAEGEKKGIGTEQSHTRYEILTERLAQSKTMSADDVRDALDSVSKKNFGEFESTEWSIVYNQSAGKVQYYHRENYENSYNFEIGAR